MDWLLERQGRIEKKLAKRHLKEGDMVLYDLTSSYFEGVKCPLAKMGKSRDRKRNTLQVNYGLVTDRNGCPVSVSVFEGNTGDPTTLMEQAKKARDDFGIGELVMVGDRGMITQKQIDELKKVDGMGWITALKTGAIRKLMDGAALQLDLFDERGLFELTHEDFPGERLVACRNPSLARKHAYKRESMIEAALDGIYVIRTSVQKKKMDADETVRNYKNLTNVERAFRSLKSIDLMVRPIRHRTEDRVRSHIFLSMLAYYVQRYMMEALRPLLFADEDQEAKLTRDPVAPAKRSFQSLEKVHTKTLSDGTAAHSFKTLLHHMSTITKDKCVQKIDGTNDNTFNIDTKPNPKQQKVYELLSKITV